MGTVYPPVYITSTGKRPGGSERIRTVGEVIDLMGNATEALRQSNRAHREACGFAHFTGLHHDPAIVREVLNDNVPNSHRGLSVAELPDRDIAYVLRYVMAARYKYERADDAARHDAAVTLSLDIDSEITRRLTQR